MKKLKLLVTASLLVGGGIFALSAADGVTSAKAAEANREYIYDFTSFDDFSTWDNSYKERVVNSENFGVADLPSAEITFDSANKQSQTITNMPVTKGSPVTFALKEEGFIVKSFTLTCKQWDTKPQTITAEYSVDNLNFDTFEPNLSSDNFVIDSGDISSYSATELQFTFSSQKNQIGIRSLSITLSGVDEISSEDYFNSLSTKTSLKASGIVDRNIREQEISLNNFTVSEMPNSKIENTNYYVNIDDIGSNISELFWNDLSDEWNILNEDGDGTKNRLWQNSDNDVSLRIYKGGKIKFTRLDEKIYNLKLDISKGTITIIDDMNNKYSASANNGNINFENGTQSVTLMVPKDTKDNVYVENDIVFGVGLISTRINSASIRFGTSIPMDKFVKEASYGVILADATKIDGDDNLNSLFDESNTSSAFDYVAYLKEQGISVYQEPFADKEIAYVATPNSTVALDETDPNAKYAQFAVVIDGLLEHMDQTFAAVCYMEYEGQLYLMKEARRSINSVVDAYLADEEIMGSLTDNSVAILNALNAM